MTQGTIQNGCNTPLNARQGSVPQMQGAMQGWYQPMTFVSIGKFLDTGFLYEVGQPTNFRGVMIPYKPRELDIKRQGQRRWKWWTLLCSPELVLSIDDGAIDNFEIQYRCANSLDYSRYGYRSYTLIEDYKGTISNLVYDNSGNVTDDKNQNASHLPNVVTE